LEVSGQRIVTEVHRNDQVPLRCSLLVIAEMVTKLSIPKGCKARKL
jgi:hypothetical protein